MTKQLFQPRDTRAVSLLFSNSVGFLLLRLGVSQDQRTDLNTRVVSVLQDKVPATPLPPSSWRTKGTAGNSIFFIDRCEADLVKADPASHLVTVRIIQTSSQF